jgi:tol-pal system protein YbgF
MNKRLASLVMIGLLLFSTASPAFAVSKEIIQLQTQVQQLQDQMARMQQQFDAQMAIQKSLIEQTTDNVNKMSQTVDNLQKTLQQQNTDNGAKVDQVSGQVQALHDSVDELKARLNQISQKLDQMSNQQQNIGTNVPGNNANQAPPPQTLYDNALRDYNANKNELAMQEFQDYLKFYPNEALAGNAQFYAADIEYRQGNFQQAITDYNRVLDQYPGGNKNAAAQLKKGFALAELGQKDAAIKELNSLIARYPKSPEAAQARERLRQLGGGRPSARHTTPH